ncbi:MAG: hypothetical protein JW915_21245 [Chitinispirillaceae bacterium]|nr:hypothetical protein [Chitinispirillaceae bacterium]
MRKFVAFFLFLLAISPSISAQKTVYIPGSIKSMNLNSSSSKYCYARSKESDNVVVFWEAGFGSDPSTASGDYRVNMATLLSVAEKAYTVYLDTLKFASKGSSVTDNYKLMIFLLYTTEWTANGSGEDEKVGSLRVNPAAANIGNVVAHEIGHCFQYITGCDTKGGYRYGLGDNGQGGNGFWEQCAQWMAFKVYPGQQFKENDFKVYLNTHHKHILHETPRYASFFIQDYWTYKYDITFTGKLWRESRSPEDPVETYKRLNSLTQAQFNDEMYEQGAHLTTWDLPDIKSYGVKYIDSRAQPKMNLTSDNFWLIDKTVCLENYGYNCIKLVAPSKAANVTVLFKGKAGASGFRVLNTNKGGWRFGFVALLADGTRKYSEMKAANVINGTNPDESLTFSCPDNCSKLWLVVSGAPQEHWKHEWDDKDDNDEQWPYQVQFKNTNLLGQKVAIVASGMKNGLFMQRHEITRTAIYLPAYVNWKIFDLAGKMVTSGNSNTIDIRNLQCGGYVLNYSDIHLKIMKNKE